MGVPAFYKWLTNKYPNIRANVKEDKGSDDIKLPNPNGLEFHNLYLDMNGIIHPCFHPDSLMFPPTTFEEVFENVFAYIDRLFSIVRPRKLLYLAIDGVAPRAKMNQQRTRRFRTAKDTEIAEEEEKRLRSLYERKGKKLLPVFESQVSDSNVITPGTEFMFELSNALKSYIVKKFETDPGWKEIKVILSDATVPGEGEHKIMSFIRTLRSLPGYDPNTRHCLYGLDADLIMLALATHEINFSILREDVINVPNQKPASETTLETTIQRAVTVLHSLDYSIEQDIKSFSVKDRSQSMLILPQQYEFLHVWILREYLDLDMQIIDLPEKFVYDFERIVDDFIFMCLFIGNDFLPHMPTLDIREDGIGLLMHVYKNEFKNLGGYLVDMECVNEPHVSFIKLKRVEKFILSVGSYEEKVFKKRTGLKENMRRREAEAKKRELDEQSSEVCVTDGQCPKDEFAELRSEVCITDDQCRPKVSTCAEQHKLTYSISEIMEMVDNTKELKEELKICVRKKSDIFSNGVIISDKVKLSSVGWKQRYYKEKFSVEDPKEVEVLRKEMVQKYTEGLCWVFMYYFSGIPSWNWYYSYHYGLFASELKGLAQVKVKFHKGSPFLPFDQLMAVLPPKSAHALPEAYRDLMTSKDSPIIEFYPRDFDIDTDGVRYLWQGTCKLPFIDQEKLLNATRQVETKIKMNEAKRNIVSTDSLLWKGSNSCLFWDFIVRHSEKREDFQQAVHEEPIMWFNLKLPVADLRAPRLLQDTQIPDKTVFENDIMETPLWHECKGRPTVTRRPVNRFQPPEGNRKWVNEEPMTHKHAGIGWCGAGRGNGNSFNHPKPYSNASLNNQCCSGDVPQSSTSAPSRGWFKQHPIQEQYTPNVNTRMESLRISPSRPNNNGSFWPSRNAPDNCQIPPWRPVSYSRGASRQSPTWRSASNASPSCRSRGNGNNPQFTTIGRGGGRGRGYYRRKSDNERSSDNHNRW